MRRRWFELPFALALLASAAMHVAALVGPGWSLPGFDEPEAGPMLEAVLTRPPAPAPAALPAQEPAPLVPKKPKLQPIREVAPAIATSPADVAEPKIPDSATAVPPLPPVAEASPKSVPPLAPVPADIALSAKGRVRYSVIRGEGGLIVGQSIHTWAQDGFTYTLRSVTETTGLAAIFKPARIVQESRGDVTADGLRPKEFRHERVGATDTASFDWERRMVTYAGREEALTPGTQDMLSMYYQIVLQVQRQTPPLVPGGALQLAIATGRKVDRYRFDVIGEETVTTALGERRATRLSARNGNDTIELWVARDLRGLPVKIRFTDRKGDIFDQLAEEASIGSLGEKP